MKHLFVTLFVVGSVGFGTCPAAAARLAGKVTVTPELRNALAEAEKAASTVGRPATWNEPNGVLPVEPPRVDPAVDLAVAIAKDGEPNQKADPLTTVEIRNVRLEPTVVLVHPGTTIRFKNVEPLDHELYCPTMPDFKPEKQSRDTFRPIAFVNTGVYEIRDKLFPHFLAWVVVSDARIVIRPGADGAFAFEELLPGKYTIKVFHRGQVIAEQPLEVKDQREIAVEIKLPAPATAPAPQAAAPPTPAGR